MKRRTVDSTKYRKQFHFRKCKFAEGMYGSSSFVYLKFLLIWILIMIADFVLEFRFEFLWPFWLLIRSLHDSFKYQGILFSIFFALIAFFSDLICYTFLPVQWLFFAASTYVWVQYVWHTGICLPTVSLWLLFVYIEASFRLKNIKTIDLCRPFAAHCIGYPIVTLGFGFKSYLSYKYRLKKQKKIQKSNEFYLQLIKQALPLELQSLSYEEEISTKSIVTAATESLNIQSDNYSKEKASKSGGLLATALSYYLNGSSSTNSSSSSSNSNQSLIEDLPYLQQKDVNNKTNFNSNNSSKNNKFNNNSNNNNNNSDYNDLIKSNGTSNDITVNKTNFSKTNLFNSTSNYSNVNGSSNKQNKQTSNSSNLNEQQLQSVNCNLSSFSISSLAYSNPSPCEQNSNQNNLNLNGINVNSNGNLLLLSSSNGPKGHHHHHRSSSSSNSSSFIPNNSNHSQTNININMTINATAIAAATASATLNSNLSNDNQSTAGVVNNNNNNNNNNPTNNSSKKSNKKDNSNKASKQQNQQLQSSQKAVQDSSNNEFILVNGVENELEKLKVEIEQQKKVEQYLRDQINYITKVDRTEKSKLDKLQQENESLQAKLTKLSTQKQKEKEELEKSLQEEKRLKFNLQTQLAHEKKLRETTTSKLTTNDVTASNLTDVNKAKNDLNLNQKKFVELENENRDLKEDCLKKQEKISNLECEIKLLTNYRESQRNFEHLNLDLNSLKEKNASLQESLSAEVKFKMDLLSALGEARRQLEFSNYQLDSKERELNALKAIFKQTFSVSSNTVSNCLINDSTQTELISQYLADQLASLQSNSTNNQTNYASSSSSPSLNDLHSMRYSPSLNNLNSTNSNGLNGNNNCF